MPSQLDQPAAQIARLSADIFEQRFLSRAALPRQRTSVGGELPPKRQLYLLDRLPISSIPYLESGVKTVCGKPITDASCAAAPFRSRSLTGSSGYREAEARTAKTSALLSSRSGCTSSVPFA